MQLKKILVIHTWGIGDWLMFSPVVAGIYKKFPAASIDIISANTGAGRVIECLQEHNLIENFNLKDGHLKFVWRAIKAAQGPYDALIFTAGMSSVKANLIAPFFRAKKKYCLRTHVGPHPFLNASPSYNSELHRLDNNMMFLDLLNITQGEREYYLPVAMHNKEISPNGSNQTTQQTIGKVLIHPGSDAGGDYKRWKPGAYRGVISQLLAREVPVTVVFGPNEKKLIKEFDGFDSQIFKIKTDLNIMELIELMQEHEVFLNNDSGLGHMATAVGLRLVSLFGPANPMETGPIGASIKILRAEKTLSCRPCMVPGGTYGCPNPVCMDEIKESKVLDEVLGIL